MAIQRTLSIIKPDATARNLTGAINAKIEESFNNGVNISVRRSLMSGMDQSTICQ